MGICNGTSAKVSISEFSEMEERPNTRRIKPNSSVKDKTSYSGNNQIKHLEEQYEKVKGQFEAEQNKNKDLQNRINYLQSSIIEAISNSNGILNEEPLTKKLHSKSNLSSNLHSNSEPLVQQLHDVMREFQVQNMGLKKQVQDLTHKLSEEMSAKVGKNESSLENISVKNRPMNIAEEYRTLCAGSWLSAKQHLDNTHKNKDNAEKKKVELLERILMVASKEASDMAGKMWQDLEQATSPVILDPFKEIAMKTSVAKEKAQGKKQKKTVPNLRPELQFGLGDHIRNQADHVDITPLVNAIMKNTQFKGLSLKPVDKYIRECGRLAWKMAIQRPPMVLQSPVVKEPWNSRTEQKVEPAWGSDINTKQACIIYCIQPMLLHGDRVMVKAKALIK